MSRFGVFTISFINFCLLYYVLLQDWFSFCRTHHQFILYIPIYAIVLLGVYALSNVIYGVATFNDCPDAYAQLKEDIKEAKETMSKSKYLRSYL